jgi:hypothetical protein
MIDQNLIERAKTKGTDKAYRRWISFQPSCISGCFAESVAGMGRNPACHVRRAGKSGTDFKEPYACAPLTHEEHRLQHAQGETYFAEKEWWDKQRIKYLEMWLDS